MKTSHVDVLRGSIIESRHRVRVAVADAAGRLTATSGVVDSPVLARSSIKALQALPLVEDGVTDRFAFTPSQLALACASHSGEPFHVAGARSMLKQAGLTESDLACGAHAPFDRDSARALRERGEAPGRVHNNCSGKHAGMLALARAHDWPIEGYYRLEHPVQQRMLLEMSRWSGVKVDDIGVAVDGCGVATFALPLARLAIAFAAFCGSADGRAGSHSRHGTHRIVEAMRAHPEMVAGTVRMCTRVMQVTGGRVVLKVGAEGVYCAAVPEAGIGVALKVEDGAKRAAEPALLAVLTELQFLTTEELEDLREFARPSIENTRGEQVGSLHADIRLERGHA